MESRGISLVEQPLFFWPPAGIGADFLLARGHTVKDGALVTSWWLA